MKAFKKISISSALCTILFSTLTIACSKDGNEAPIGQEMPAVDHSTAKTNFVKVNGTDFAYRTSYTVLHLAFRPLMRW